MSINCLDSLPVPPVKAALSFTTACCCSVAQSRPTLCDSTDCSTPGFPVLHCPPSLLKLKSIESVMSSNYLTLCRPLLLPSVFPSIRVSFKEWVFHIRWPKYWSFSISPSNKYSGLISLRTDWRDLLTAQGTLENFLNTTV